MKENKIIEIKNKVEALTRVSQHMYNEIAQIKDLAVGTLETIKKCQIMNKLSKTLKKTWLKSLVRQRRLTPLERLSSRIGYMGAGFLIAAQWTIDPRLYILGFVCVMIQTASRKQWNLVALNINGLFAWTKHLIG